MAYGIVAGTPLEGEVPELKGWKRLDTSTGPVVPRGIIPASGRVQVAQVQGAAGAKTRIVRHSKEKAAVWMERVTGRALPDRLRGANAMERAMPALAGTGVTPGALRLQTGLHVSAKKIEEARGNVASVQRAYQILNDIGFEQLQGQIQRYGPLDACLRETVAPA